jgi:hypothetical protein
MATILINVSKKKFNKCFVVNESAEYHIVNESARKTLCNLFDALGNISSYNDYNAFLESYSGFSKFNKCTCSKLLKVPLEMGQGILVTIDKQSKTLTLPTIKQLDWFLGKYQYSTINVCSSDSEDCIEHVEEQHLEEEHKEEEHVEEKQEETKEPKKEEPVSSITSSIWSFFGWNK